MNKDFSRYDKVFILENEQDEKDLKKYGWVHSDYTVTFEHLVALMVGKKIGLKTDDTTIFIELKDDFNKRLEKMKQEVEYD